MMAQHGNNASILLFGMRYLKNLSVPLSINAQRYYCKTIISLALTYPYIVPLLDECVFQLCKIDHNTLQDYINLIFNRYLQERYFEGCSYALFYALEYKLEIADFDIAKIIEQEDCILYLMSLLYCWAHNLNNAWIALRDKALEIKSRRDFDEFWPFAYECLFAEDFPKECHSKDGFPSDWRELKDSGVSFLKPEYYDLQY